MSQGVVVQHGFVIRAAQGFGLPFAAQKLDFVTAAVDQSGADAKPGVAVKKINRFGPVCRKACAASHARPSFCPPRWDRTACENPDRIGQVDGHIGKGP
jgi:hypothetical protein